jgi:hypothetical protein
MIENLKELKDKGMKKFLEIQESRYKCSNCGDVISVHNRKCYVCGLIEPNKNLLKKT